MRNLGALVLAYIVPEEYDRVFEALTDEVAADKRAIEEEIIGLTAPKAGEWLADRWHMPASVVRVIAQCDNSDY